MMQVDIFAWDGLLLATTQARAWDQKDAYTEVDDWCIKNGWEPADVDWEWVLA